MQNSTWFIVADSNRARVFSALTDSEIKNGHVTNELNLVQELDHHDSHKKNQDVISDKAASNTTGTFVESTDPKEGEAANFAKNIAIYLEKNRNDHQYGNLVIVAPPHFLGLLNQHFSKEVEKLVSKSLSKDYTSEDIKSLSKHLLGID